MKKGMVVILLVAAVVGMWWGYRSSVQSAKASVRGDPVRAVEAFMGAIVKVSGLMWDEGKQAALKSELEELERSAPRGDKQLARDVFAKYGAESPAYLFKEQRLGKAAAAALAMFHLEAFSIKETRIREDAATVTVEFLPKDVFGLKKLVSELGAPQREEEKKPVVVPFHLEKSGHKWYITDIRGELEPVVKASYRLGR